MLCVLWARGWSVSSTQVGGGGRRQHHSRPEGQAPERASGAAAAVRQECTAASHLCPLPLARLRTGAGDAQAFGPRCEPGRLDEAALSEYGCKVLHNACLDAPYIIVHGVPDDEPFNEYPAIDVGWLPSRLPGYDSKPVRGRAGEKWVPEVIAGGARASPQPSTARCLSMHLVVARAPPAPGPHRPLQAAGQAPLLPGCKDPERHPYYLVPVVRKNSSQDRPDLRSPVFSACATPLAFVTSWTSFYSEFFFNRCLAGFQAWGVHG